MGEGLTVDQLVQLVREFGFPAVVAGYVLVRVDRQLAALNRTLGQILVQLALNGSRRRHDDIPSP